MKSLVFPSPCSLITAAKIYNDKESSNCQSESAVYKLQIVSARNPHDQCHHISYKCNNTDAPAREINECNCLVICSIRNSFITIIIIIIIIIFIISSLEAHYDVMCNLFLSTSFSFFYTAVLEYVIVICRVFFYVVCILEQSNTPTYLFLVINTDCLENIPFAHFTVLYDQQHTLVNINTHFLLF